MKSEIRNSKSERNPSAEIRKRSLARSALRVSDLILALALLAAGTVYGDDMQPATLKDTFSKAFLIGVAVNRDQFTEKDSRGAAIAKAQFNAISPENVLKWESVHPKPDKYDFEGPDRYVEFGEKNHMVIIGHTLCWHNQTPDWVFHDEKGNLVDRDTLLQRLRDHIHTVVGRYKGRIKAWDVVNEAVDEDGSLRATNRWHQIIGDDYIAKAFEFAHEADPAAGLNYNDFDLEKPAKRAGVIALIRKLQAQHVPITGLGSQMHVRIDSPTVAETEAAFDDFEKLGLKIMVTELDVDVLPEARSDRGADLTKDAALRAKLDIYPNGVPDSVQQAFAKRYADLFHVFLKHRDKIDRVTFWCVTDGDSWLNYWPVHPRTDYPLLFDRDGKPKPAFYAVLQTARDAKLAR
jgi:endo-1,4-beta-xylanase